MQFDYRPFCPLRSNGEHNRIDCSPDCRWLIKVGKNDDGCDYYACAVVAIAEHLILQQEEE